MCESVCVRSVCRCFLKCGDANKAEGATEMNGRPDKILAPEDRKARKERRRSFGKVH